MPTPPAESIGGRLVSRLKENVKDKRKCLDFMMASVIFIVSVLELISWRFSQGDQAVITNPGNNYLVYWFPLMSSLTVWVFSLFFLLKIFRYKACVYTKLVTIIYFSIQTFNISAYVLKFGSKLYNDLIYPVFLFSILGLTFLKVLRWLLQKQQ